MPTIQITDTSSASVNASLFDTSVLGQTPASVLHFLRADVIGALDQTLDQVQINSVSIGFDYEPAVALAGGTVGFTAGGGPTGEIDLLKPAGGDSSPLFPSDQFGTDIEMGSNYYLALSFQLALSAQASGGVGAFAIAPSASASGSATLYLPYAKGADNAYPTLKSALETLFSSYLLPSSEADLLDKLPVGAVFAYDTQGSVGFQAQFDFLAAINPTASLGVSPSFGPISITAGPSVTVGGGFTLSGELEVRFWKKSATVVQIGYYKKKGSSLAVSFDASVGADVTVEGYDVISKIYGLLGDSGTLDPAWLSANVPAAVAGDVAEAYQSAVQTKLSIAIDAECDTSITDQAAFSWNFDLSALDAAGHTALENLFKSDLSMLLSSGALPAGITRAGSVLDHTKETTYAFTFNFLGLFDHASVNDAVLDLATQVSDDGQIILTDTAHLTRLSASATPTSPVKADQLRKVYAEDCVATMGYAASLGGVVVTPSVAYNYFFYEKNAHPADLQLFVETATKLGKAGAAGDWAAALQSGLGSQAASIFASLGYDGATSTKLFLDASGNPRTIADYQEVGRKTLLLAPGLGLDPKFIACLNNPATWQQLINVGSTQGIYQILGADLANTPVWAVYAGTCTLHTVYWASAMHSAAQALQDVLQYLKANPGNNTLQDANFQKKRKTFAGQLQSAIQKASLFNDEFRLMALYDTATPVSDSVSITYAGVTKNYA